MKRRIGLIAAALSAGALALTACGASNTGGGTEAEPGGESTDSPYATCTVGETAKDVSSTEGTGEDGKDISIAAFSGWDESTATAYLMKHVLEEDGYTVKVQTLDAAPAFTAAAKGDVDVLTDVWLPTTHATYIDEYGEDIEPLGCWYDHAKLTIAVNSDSPAKSIADLPDMVDDYNGELIGIEPGAGLTKQTEEEAIPTYGLEDYEFTATSTSAMLASIKRAENKGENVVVTLWRPHWAYAAFDIRDLEDPEGAMGGSEGIWNFATKGFEDEHPKAAQLFRNMTLPDDQLGDLEDLMVNKYDGEDPEAAVEDWVKDNPDFADQLAKGELAAS